MSWFVIFIVLFSMVLLAAWGATPPVEYIEIDEVDEDEYECETAYVIIYR